MIDDKSTERYDAFEIHFEYEDPQEPTTYMFRTVFIDNADHRTIWFHVGGGQSEVCDWITIDKAEEIGYALITAAHNLRLRKEASDDAISS